MDSRYLKMLITLVVVITFFFFNNVIAADHFDNYKIKQYYESILPDSPPDNMKGTKWMYRWLWDYRFDIKPDGSSVNYPETELYRSEKSKNDNNDHILSESGWIPVGPKAFPPSFDPRSGHGLGRINCVAFHPSDPDIFWIGTPNGGVWKTENSGETWIPLSDDLSTLGVSHIAVDPDDPDIVYLVSGDVDGGGITHWKSKGVFKSTDGGLSWIQTDLVYQEQFGGSLLRRLLINPDNTDELMVAGMKGIWKSDDAGESWRFILDSLVTDMEADPVTPNIVYAALGTYSRYYGFTGIMKSIDFGETWEILDTGMPEGFEISRVEISISPADPDYIYAVGVNDDPQNNSRRSGLHSFYMTTDAGETWAQTAHWTNNSNMLGWFNGDSTDTRGQGTYDLVLQADASDKNKVYVGGVNVWMSENAGLDWEIVSMWINCCGTSIHADQHFAAYNPVDQYYYFCNDGGIYRSQNIKPGSKDWIGEWIDRAAEDVKPGAPEFTFPTQWENLSSGLSITEFYRMGLCKTEAGYVTAGAQDNSCYYYDNYEWINYVPNYDGMETLIDHDDPQIIYGVWQFGGLNKSYDGGKTVIPGLADTIKVDRGERGVWITPTTMDPVYPDIIYMGFRNLWKSTDGGYKWSKLYNFDDSVNTTNNRNSIELIKHSPTDPDYMCFYKSANWYYDEESESWLRGQAEFWLTKDGGDTWDMSTEGLAIDSMSIIAMDYDYNNPERMWVAYHSWDRELNMSYTDDGGESWRDDSRTMPSSTVIYSMLRDPGIDNDLIYAGTNHGVFYTYNGIDEWLPLNKNLPNTLVRDLEYQLGSQTLYAATYGRGVWKTDLLSSVEDLHKATAFKVYPNPSKGMVNIELASDMALNTNAAKLRIINITGQTILSDEMDFGANKTKSLDLQLENGVYFLQLIIDGRNYSEKLIIDK